jgi:hypothetical protein
MDRRSSIHFIIFLLPQSQPMLIAGQTLLQHCSEPSTKSLLGTSGTLQGTFSTFTGSPGTFIPSTIAVPTIITCESGSIGDNADIVGAGIWGREWMRGDPYSPEIMQIPRVYCSWFANKVRVASFLHPSLILMAWRVADSASLYMTSQLMTLKAQRQFMLYVRLVLLASAPNLRTALAARLQCETYFPSFTARKHPTAATSLCRRVGYLGEELEGEPGTRNGPRLSCIAAPGPQSTHSTPHSRKL